MRYIYIYISVNCNTLECASPDTEIIPIEFDHTLPAAGHQKTNFQRKLVKLSFQFWQRWA